MSYFELYQLEEARHSRAENMLNNLQLNKIVIYCERKKHAGEPYVMDISTEDQDELPCDESTSLLGKRFYCFKCNK